MKIKEIHFLPGGFSTVRSEHVSRLVANDKLTIELDLATLSVRVDDRNNYGEGVYHVPLACLRRWVPLEEPKAIKKAAGQ